MPAAIGIVFGAMNSGRAHQFKMALATSNLAADISKLVAVTRSAWPSGEGKVAPPGKCVDFLNLSSLELEYTRVSSPSGPVGPPQCHRTGGNTGVEAGDVTGSIFDRERETVTDRRKISFGLGV